VAIFSCTANGDTLSCDASQSQNASSYFWEFLDNDGGTASGVTASQQYTISGIKTVRLTVTGSGGQQDSDTNSYSVTVP